MELQDTPGNIQINEKELLGRIAHGDNSAFDQIIALYQDRIFNTLYRYTGNYDDAKDLCQDTFLNAFKSISSFKEQASFYTWIYRIAINLCISRQRSNVRRPATPMSAFSKPDSGDDRQFDLPDSEMNPVSTIEQREKNAIIQKAINSLSEDSRQAIILRDINGLSYDEIAEVLELPTGTVRSRIHRGRSELKEILKDMELF